MCKKREWQPLRQKPQSFYNLIFHFYLFQVRHQVQPFNGRGLHNNVNIGKWGSIIRGHLGGYQPKILSCAKHTFASKILALFS